MYGLGESVLRDETESAKWYRKAAEQGHSKAQMELGYMYAWGRGVDQDYVQAEKWYLVSAAAGNSDVAAYPAYVEKRMTPAQIAEAQKLAADWTPTGTNVATSARTVTAAQQPPALAMATAPAPTGSTATASAGSALPASAEVPFTVDLPTQSFDGLGRLDNGHITGMVQAYGRPINLSADVNGNSVTARLDGNLSPAGGQYGSRCVATGEASPASGKVTISMQATCTIYNPRVVLHLDLQAAAS